MDEILHNAPISGSISVVICTRDRGARIVSAVRSILAAGGYDELVVIDQSATSETRDALALFIARGALRWIGSETRGSGISRTIGLGAARSEFVAFTDDDCIVEDGWLEAHRDAFLRYPNAVLGYGAVLPVEYDAARGYIPDYRIAASKLCVSPRDKVNARGIGANFAVRRQAILDLGGFDPCLGAGALFYSAEDRDLTLRCFLAGLGVYECAESRVIHDGFRDWADGRKHTCDDWFGLGAVFAKPVFARQWRSLPFLAHEFTQFALFPFLRTLPTPAKQKGFLRLHAFLAGFVRGGRTPMESGKLIYEADGGIEIYAAREQKLNSPRLGRALREGAGDPDAAPANRLAGGK